MRMKYNKKPDRCGAAPLHVWRRCRNLPAHGQGRAGGRDVRRASWRWASACMPARRRHQRDAHPRDGVLCRKNVQVESVPLPASRLRGHRPGEGGHERGRRSSTSATSATSDIASCRASNTRSPWRRPNVPRPDCWRVTRRRCAPRLKALGDGPACRVQVGRVGHAAERAGRPSTTCSLPSKVVNVLVGGDRHRRHAHHGTGPAGSRVPKASSACAARRRPPRVFSTCFNDQQTAAQLIADRRIPKRWRTYT